MWYLKCNSDTTQKFGYFGVNTTIELQNVIGKLQQWHNPKMYPFWSYTMFELKNVIAKMQQWYNPKIWSFWS